MINEFDHVKIKTNGIIGEVVDVYVSNEEKIFVVESDKKVFRVGMATMILGNSFGVWKNN